MRCAKCRELISRSFDEDLGERERGQLVEHLADCADCQQHHSILDEGRELLAAGMVDVPENFEWKVQLKIQKALREGATTLEEPRSLWAFWGSTAASATAVAALVLVVGSLLMRPVTEVTPQREFHLPGALAESTPVDPSASPDLSGARPVQGLDLDAFRDGYGIRTVSDHLGFAGLRENYPMAGRSSVRRGGSAVLEELTRGIPSQGLHLRLVNTKLRAVPVRGDLRAPVSTTMADSAANGESPRR